jgi:hypothetical protein
MALLIQTTGIEDYAPGGKARVKVLVIGGPGVGKTRWSSYFPDPIYADCEGGLASVADRKVPYVRINSSEDMSDLLAHVKQECRQPAAQRKYQTLVIDTLDAYQRKVKDEWMLKEKKETFTGWEAWGYLNSRMQALMTRLLNLDLNVVVLVHFKDKTTTDDNTGKETHTLQLQVQGELGDTAFNDFDLVAWMGTYWEAVDGERVQKRGLTFKATPDKPFLKDRLFVTPPWMEVTFADSDYTQLFDAIQSRIGDLSAGEVVGQIEAERPEPSGFVIAPGAIGTGPLPGAGAPPPALTYQQMDKPTLTRLAREKGVTVAVDGTPIRGNTLKAELVAALEAHDATTTALVAEAAAPTGPTTPDTGDPAPAPANEPTKSYADAQLAKEPAALPTEPDAPQPGVISVPEGQVNTTTGELIDTVEKAVEMVQNVLGGVVIADKVTPVAPTPAPASATSVVCEDCSKDLKGEDPDFVKLSWIKFRKRLCEEDFKKTKAAQR